MYVYNVTVTIDPSIHEDWLEWMRSRHIPDVLRTGYFLENKLLRLITDEKEITYAVQYTFSKLSDLESYRKEHAPRLQQEHSERYKDKFAAFRTILEIV